VPAGGGSFGGTARSIPEALYNSVLHDPKVRDPRGYIIPSDQADFATATEFINALLKNGITIDRATAAFQVAGKSYPAGSCVVKTAQAFRPHVMDMFEPQDHPNDFAYPGGPPKRPYDITGWTLDELEELDFDDDRDDDPPQDPYAELLPAVDQTEQHRQGSERCAADRQSPAKRVGGVVRGGALDAEGLDKGVGREKGGDQQQGDEQSDTETMGVRRATRDEGESDDRHARQQTDD
jgi:hypothetical protein